MIDLKPCPFCGQVPHPLTAQLGTRPCFYYECENSKCQASEKGWHNTEQDAIDAWNSRPIEDKLRARIAELEAMTLEEFAHIKHKQLYPNEQPDRLRGVKND